MTAESLDLGVASVVLLSAALHAVWNALVKVRGDQVVTMTVVTTAGALVGLCAVPFLPLPLPAAWPFLGAALAAHLAFSWPWPARIASGTSPRRIRSRAGPIR